MMRVSSVLKKVENVDSSTIETIKGKRGRKSKKELMASLNIDQYALIKEKHPYLSFLHI